MLDRAITIGMWAGFVTGYFAYGLIPVEAKAFLDRLPCEPQTAQEEGILRGLIKVGLVERRGWIFNRSYHRRASRPQS